MTLADQILYEDNHLIALNKLPGQIVQGDKTGDRCMADDIKAFIKLRDNKPGNVDRCMADDIKAFIKLRDNKPGNVFCGVIHRLDRPVSGVTLFAKTGKALSRMNEMVKNRQFHKIYHAIVGNTPPSTEGHLEDYLTRNEKLNKSFVANGPTMRDAKLASLDYRLLATSQGGYHLLEIELHTGRHHQIRCQLAHLGCPIKGDLKYGAPRSNPDGSISLHAYQLVFEHPVRHEAITITAPDPWHLFEG